MKRPKKNSRREFLRQAAGVTLGSTVLGVSALAADGPGDIELARDGKSGYSIVLGRDASPSEERAARELQRFLGEICGARLPIVAEPSQDAGDRIFVGRSKALDALAAGIPFETMGPEGFALKTAGKHLIIAGGRERGTMYGVSTFLQKLGCRWFTRDVSRIPRRPILTIPQLDEVQQPAFEYRFPYALVAFDRDWAARNKVNGDFAAPADASYGGTIKYFPFVHSFIQMFPPDKYFAEHPEYFPLIDGQRRSERVQLCLTNAGMLQAATAVVFRWIEEHPDVNIISVSQNDWDGWCECGPCQKIVEEEGATSGLLLRFVNAIAERVEVRYPKILIDTLAYQMTEAPPGKARPRQNVRVRLCPIGNCEAHPYETCPHNTYFMRNLRGWAAITRQLYVWHYLTNFTHHLLPFPNFDELAADAEMYRRNGVVGIFLQDDMGTHHDVLRAYVGARLLWNPRVDVQRDVADFHEEYYGRAARPMLKYFDLLHGMVRPSPQGEGQHIFIRRSPVFSTARLLEARKLFQEAENLADTKVILGRVQKSRLTVDYAELVAGRRFSVVHGQYGPIDLPKLTESFTRFMAEARRLDATLLHTDQAFEADEHQFAAHMKPSPAVQLENQDVRVDIVPGLSGRVAGLIDKRTGRNMVRCAEPEELWSEAELWNPDFGGIGLFPYADRHHRRPIPTRWAAEPGAVKRRVCRLTGESENGLRFERTLQLDGAAAQLRTRTMALNAGTKPVTFALQSVLETNPADRNRILELDVRFRRRDGEEVHRQVSSLTQVYLGKMQFKDEQLPSGEWHVKHQGLSTLFLMRFDTSQVEACTAQWRARGENRVILGVWSHRRTLAPGDKFELAVSYEIRRA